MRSRTLAIAPLAAVLLASPAAANAQPFQDAARTNSLAAAPAPGAPAPIVCVIDTGVNITPTLAGRVIARDTVTSNPSVDDSDYDPNNPASGHGTFVAETIAATWPQARIVSVRTSENGGVQTALYPQAINACSNMGATVMNLSLASATPADTQQPAYLRNAVAKANGEGRDVVVAAGNSPGPVQYPGNSLADIATVVGAANNAGAPCSFASTGPETLLGAPGCPVELPSAGGQMMAMSGSSFSAPQVAATMAAVQAYAPSLTHAQRRDAVTGLPGGVLNGDEVLRRIGRADLVPAQAPTSLGTGTPGPATTTSPAGTTSTSNQSTKKKKVVRPTISVRWVKRRIVIRALRATTKVHLTVRIGTRKSLLISSGPKLTVPLRLSKSRVRLVVRVVDRRGKRLASRILLAPRRR